MEFADYSPPASPTAEQQRDALRKGLGRSLQWAKAGKIGDETLLEACLHDLRFDHQIDGCRGAWLWEILTAANDEQRFREPIFDAFQSLSDEENANQLCGLGLHFASAGDERFRKRLYDIVEQRPFAHYPWLGEEEIIALDGDKGLLFTARVRGRQLSTRDWEFDDLNPVEEAIKRLGEERVVSLLESAEDEPLRRYRDAWLHHRNMTTVSKESYRERMQAITVKEIINGAEEGGTSPGLFRGWGIHASIDDLETVFARLLTAREPRVIENYLRVFSKRSVPRLDPALFSLCQHQNENVRNRALTAVAQVSDPLVREFALGQLGESNECGGVIELFIRNYKQNDERRILDALTIPDDQGVLHWLLMDVVKVLEANPTADCSQLGVIAYATTPCGACRHWAARHLHKQHASPEWLVAECRFDSESNTRQLEQDLDGIRPSGT